MIGISACLGGCPCRYDGKEQGKKQLIQLVEEKQAVMICPEVLGGLSTPRDPAEFVVATVLMSGKIRQLSKPILARM